MGKYDKLPNREKYGLTVKQYEFVKKYVELGHVVNAYKTVYNSKGSEQSISGQAYKLFNNPKVQLAINDIQRIAFSKAVEEVPEVMSAIELMTWWSTIIKSTNRSIKMSDRIKCSELLGKAQGIFTQRIEADINANQDIVINITDNKEDGEEND